MDKNLNYFRKGTEFLLFASVVGALIAGCGGGGSNSASNGGSGPAGTSSATITPYKGPFSSGTVTLKDANGNPVTILSGGTINASGVANVTYNANVAYPLVVEVTGSYYNENTGIDETATVPLRSVVTKASNAIPVTIVTETAVADLQNRLGGFAAMHPIQAASAVAALDTASTMLGIPASAVPAFDPVTRKTGDADTLRLAALAVVANGQAGANLSERVKTLANTMATLNPASAPSSVINQAALNAAMTAMTSGASSVAAAGIAAPTAPTVSTTTVGMISNNANIASANSGVGSWIMGSNTNTLLTFFANGDYMQSESVVNGPANIVQPGLEHGTYTWNASTGAFAAACPTVDTNLQAGFSAPNGVQCTAGTTAARLAVTVNGNAMTVVDNSVNPAVTLTFNRVIDAINPIVGSWANLKVNGVAPAFGTPTTTVLTFFANGDYMQSESVVSGPAGTVQPGIEHGTYTWNSSTGAFTATCPTVDTNLQAGFSAPSVGGIATPAPLPVPLQPV